MFVLIVLLALGGMAHLRSPVAQLVQQAKLPRQMDQRLLGIVIHKKAGYLSRFLIYADTHFIKFSCADNSSALGTNCRLGKF